MASMIQPVDNDNSEEITPSTSKQSSTNEVFMPKDTLDQPCDILLVVEDGKQFKARRKVLSEASPFFEKLLNSDMKESKEGIVRLEMFSESVMAATMEFIYTGHVQILTEDNGRDLIVMADYLFLPRLKALAQEVLIQRLDISNCISIYYFSERYQCEELLSKAKKFILANFTAVYAANREDVLNMSNKEVELWISSDEIEVSAEDDVFKIILAWTEHDKDKRNKYFAELFRQVRLVYVSRDFLSSDVVTNDLVKGDKDCLDIVKNAMSFIDSRRFDNLSVSPRKSLKTSAIIMYDGKDFLSYYFPDMDNWCTFIGKIPSEFVTCKFPCEGKLYGTRIQNCDPMSHWWLEELRENERIQNSRKVAMVSYNPYTNSCTHLPLLDEICIWGTEFVTNEDEMWALSRDKTENLFILKYNPLLHSWQEVAPCNQYHSSRREGCCVLASGNFIYFIGGVMYMHEESPVRRIALYLSDVDRYDLSKDQWDKVANIQVARSGAYGAAGNGRIFIAGGLHQESHLLSDPQCEMYDKTTNEWQLIASFKKPGAIFHRLLAADGEVYAVNSLVMTYARRNPPGYPSVVGYPQLISVDRYNPEKNEWETKTQKEFPQSGLRVTACSLRIFKGLFNFYPQGSSNPESLSTQASSSHQEARKQKCVIA